MRPDLSDPKQREAYRAELRGVARGWRSGGLALVITGTAGLLFHVNEEVPIMTSDLGRISIGLIGIGVVLAVIGVVQRTRYHAGRMAGR